MPDDEKLFARLDEIIAEALAQEFEYAQGLGTDEPVSEDVVRRILREINAYLPSNLCEEYLAERRN